MSFKRLVNLIRTEVNLRRNKLKIESYPYWALVDPCNVCNLNCTVCPSGGRKDLFKTARGVMKKEDFERIVDGLGDYLFHIVLYNWGEPLLNKEFVEILEIAKRKNIGIEISTNLQILDEKLAEGLVTGGLDRMVVSCDGASQETYEKYRKGGSYQKVVDNIKLLAETKKRLNSVTPVIDVQFIVFSHNEHEIPDTKKFYDYGADLVSVTRNCLLVPEVIEDSIKLLPKKKEYDHWEGQYEIRKDGTVIKVPLTFCSLFYRQIAINPNGDIYPCCGPSHVDSYKFGNFFDSDFMGIWNSPQYQCARGLNSGKQCNNACGFCFSEKWWESK